MQVQLAWGCELAVKLEIDQAFMSRSRRYQSFFMTDFVMHVRVANPEEHMKNIADTRKTTSSWHIVTRRE